MATQTTVEHRSYKLVPGLSIDNSDYVVPDGATIVFNHLGGNSPTSASSTYMKIVWDPSGDNTIVFGTYSAGFQFSSLSFVGDGTKVLRISLVNNDATSRIVGGYVNFTLSQ